MDDTNTPNDVKNDPLLWFTDNGAPVAVRKSCVVAVVPQSTGRTAIDYRGNANDTLRSALVNESTEEVKRRLGE